MILKKKSGQFAMKMKLGILLAFKNVYIGSF